MAADADKEILGADVEMDLDAPAPANKARPPRPAVLVHALWAVVGALVGGYVVHVWSAPPPPPAPQPIVHMSLGAYSSGVQGVRDGKAIVGVDAVVTNDGQIPVSVAGVAVQGPGAGLTYDYPGPPQARLPVKLFPGGTAELPFAVTSDCAVPIRPLPKVLLSLRTDDGQTRTVEVRIPDLDALWGQSLAPHVCSGTRTP